MNTRQSAPLYDRALRSLSGVAASAVLALACAPSQPVTVPLSVEGGAGARARSTLQVAGDPDPSGRSSSAALGGAPRSGEIAAGPATYCRRSDATCWLCAPVQFPAELPCEGSSGCDGLCFQGASGPRCANASLRCCDSGDCATPPIVSACQPECGDPNGDGTKDRCLVREICPDQAKLKVFSERYHVASSPALYQALCGALPAPPSFPDSGASPEQATCPPTNVVWTIHPELMNGASDKTGPGLCYGRLLATEQGTLRGCGKFHCQTLRFCDGHEKPAYCTVLSTCEDGHVKPTGLTW